VPTTWSPSAGCVPTTALHANLALVERPRTLAHELGCSVDEVAIAWALAQDGVTRAIVGACRPEQLGGWIGAAHLDLSDELLRAINAAITADADQAPAFPGSPPA
jgi:aryl-alcohol dehydrogenase-like predicted oxidoreductase